MSLPIILGFLSVLLVIWFFISFDKIVKQEHDIAYQQWVEDGQPTGMFWWVSGVRPSPRSNLASLILMFGWLFDTPEWARNNNEAINIIRRYRISALIVILAVLSLIFFD